MISSKQDLLYYMECDKKALGIDHKRPRLVGDRIWKYERLYRRTEYYCNNSKNVIFKIRAKFYSLYWKYNR